MHRRILTIELFCRPNGKFKTVSREAIYTVGAKEFGVNLEELSLPEISLALGPKIRQVRHYMAQKSTYV